MSSNVIRFPHPWLPIEGKEMLRVRRTARTISRKVAIEAVNKAWFAVMRSPELKDLGVMDAFPGFLLAMRRAVRDLERGHGLPAPPETSHE